MGYSPWGRTESDTTELLHFHFHLLLIFFFFPQVVAYFPFVYLVLKVFLCFFISIVFFVISASLIAQLVKNPPAMQETQVRFLCQEDQPAKG